MVRALIERLAKPEQAPPRRASFHSLYLANFRPASALLPPCSSHTMVACCVNPTEGGEVPMRFLIAFCVGVAATLAWQSYGDTAREMVASKYPQLGWLGPQAAVAQTVPDTVVPSISSTDPQELKAMSLNLAAVRQKVDLLAAGQAQMTRDFTTKLQAAEQEILDKISAPPPQPAAAPARKSASPPLPLTPAR